jgi:hypothetical protein
VPEEDGRSVLGRDEEVDGRRSGVMTSTELDSGCPGALERGKRDFVDEGERVAVELEERDDRGMWVGEFGLADEKTRLDSGGFGDSASRGKCSGGGTGEPFDREEADNRFGDIEGERPSSGIL